MRKVQLMLCAYTLLTLTGADLNAQKMYVKSNSGTLTTIPFTEIEKIIYSTGNMIINESGGNTQSLSLTEIRRQSYVDWDLITSNAHVHNLPFELVLSSNPVRDLLSISIPKQLLGNYTIEIVGTDGKTYLAQTSNAAINVSRLKRGVYICRLITQDVVLFKKFIKQ